MLLFSQHVIFIYCLKFYQKSQQVENERFTTHSFFPFTKTRSSFLSDMLHCTWAPSLETRGRRGDLIVNVLHSGSSSPVRARARTMRYVLGKTFNSHIYYVSPQEYKWVSAGGSSEGLLIPVECQETRLGTTLRWSSIRSRVGGGGGVSNTPS